jgi:hypothetical protein
MKASLDSIMPQQGLEPQDLGIDVGGCEPPPISNPSPDPPVPPDVWVEPEIFVNPAPQGPDGPESPEPPEIITNPVTQGPEGPDDPVTNPIGESPWTEILQGGIQLGEDSPFKKLG